MGFNSWGFLDSLEDSNCFVITGFMLIFFNHALQVSLSFLLGVADFGYELNVG